MRKSFCDRCGEEMIEDWEFLFDEFQERPSFCDRCQREYDKLTKKFIKDFHKN